MMTEEGRRELSEYSPANNNANTNSTVKDMLLGCACVNMKVMSHFIFYTSPPVMRNLML